MTPSVHHAQTQTRSAQRTASSMSRTASSMPKHNGGTDRAGPPSTGSNPLSAVDLRRYNTRDSPFLDLDSPFTLWSALNA